MPPSFEQQYAACDERHIHPQGKISNFTGLSIGEFITTAEWKEYHQSNPGLHIADKLAIEAICQDVLVCISLAMVQFVDPLGPKTPQHPQFNFENFNAVLTNNNPNLKVEILAESELIKQWFRSFAKQFQTAPELLNLPSIVMGLAHQSVFQPDPQYISTEDDNFYKLALLAAELRSSIPCGLWIEWSSNSYLNSQSNLISAAKKIFDLVGELGLKYKLSRHFICIHFKYLAFNLMGWNSKENTPFSKAELLFEAERLKIQHDRAAPQKEYWIKQRAAARQKTMENEERVRQLAAENLALRTLTAKCLNCPQEFQYVEPVPVIDIDGCMSSIQSQEQFRKLSSLGREEEVNLWGVLL